MQIKMYVPTNVEIPSEYMVPLAQRARDSIGDGANTTPATRGHLVRQAIRDGLLRGMDNLIGETARSTSSAIRTMKFRWSSRTESSRSTSCFRRWSTSAAFPIRRWSRWDRAKTIPIRKAA